MVMNDQYETGRSSIKIGDTAKGSTVDVKIYASPVPENERVAKILRDLQGLMRKESVKIPVNWYDQVVNYIKHLRSLIPDTEAAQIEANRLHLKAAAQVEINGGIIVYDPDKALMGAWLEMEKHDAEHS